MKNTKFLLVLLVCILFLVLSACASGTPKQIIVSDDAQEQAEKVEGLPMPFSNGPSGPPSVKGPTMPVPEAVTETENAEFRLPEENGS